MKLDSSSHGDTIKEFPYFEDFDCVFPVKESKSEYDPQDYARSVYEIGFAGASLHLIRAAIGTTILLTPFAFSLVGYGVALITMLCASVLYVSNLRSLLWTEYQLCKMLKVPRLTFASVVERSFEAAPESWRILYVGPCFKFVIYLYWALPSANGIYLIAISDSCRQALNHLGLVFENTLPAVVMVMMGLCLLPRLKFLVPLSAFASILTLLNLATISIISTDVTHWREAKVVGDLTKIPQFLAIFSNAVGITAMVIPLKNEMATPKQFLAPFGVLNTSFGVILLIITSFGLLGYLNCAGVPENILLNLQQDYVSSVVLILYIFCLCSTYMLIFYSYDDTWNGFLAARLKGRYETVARYCLRVSINVVAYGMAAIIRDFGLLVTMVGTVGILMEICLPSLLHLLVCRVVPTKPAALWFLVLKNSAVIILSTIVFVMSTKTCISDVIKVYRKKMNH